jgi:hypothetical protein
MKKKQRARDTYLLERQMMKGLVQKRKRKNNLSKRASFSNQIKKGVITFSP